MFHLNILILLSITSVYALSNDHDSVKHQSDSSSRTVRVVDHRSSRLARMPLVDDNNGEEDVDDDDTSRQPPLDKMALATMIVAGGSNNSTTISASKRGHRGRFCTTSTDCHLDLNERCVSRGTHSICDCREPFLRDTKTNSCELKRAVQIGISFTRLAFISELAKKSTPAFIRTRERVEKTLMAVIHYSPILDAGVHDIRAVNFTPDFSGTANNVGGGAAADTAAAAVAVEIGLSATCLMFVRESLYRHLTLDALSLLLVKEVSVAVHELNATNTSGVYDMEVIEIETDINPCKLDELNYCSEHADCGRTKYGGFYCQCRDRYSDLSPHPAFVGEKCAIECPDEYCANQGHCHVDTKSAALYCTCNNWNVGARCQYSGIVVFSVLGIVVVLLLLVVGCTASAFCGQRAAAIQRELAFALPKSVTPNYEDHIRPFRITIDNPYDAPDLSIHDKRLSQPHIRTRTASFDGTVNHHQVSSSTAPTTPCASPRMSLPCVAVAAVQTDPPLLEPPRITVMEALLDNPKTQNNHRRSSSGLKVPVAGGASMTAGTAVTVASKAKPCSNQQPIISYF